METSPSDARNDLCNPTSSRDGKGSSLDCAGEEPLHLCKSEGGGYFPGIPETYLKECYEIKLKLGWDERSSTWLVEDNEEYPSKYYMAIILTAHATELENSRASNELEGLRTIATATDDSHSSPLNEWRVPYLIDFFETNGPHGTHLCFIVNPLSTDLETYRLQSPTGRVPMHTLKYVTKSMSMSLRILNEIKMVHLNINPQNILFNVLNDQMIETSVLEAEPGKIVDVQICGKTYPLLRSQPLRHSYRWNDGENYIGYYEFCLAGFGKVQREGATVDSDTVSSYAAFSPEIVLGGPVTSKTDVWSLGCMVFHLLTGRHPFQSNATDKQGSKDDYLSMAMAYSDETFKEAFLNVCSHREEYLLSSDELLRPSQMKYHSIENTIASLNLPDLDEVDIEDASSFILTCLRLNPEDRACAEDVGLHPFLLSRTGFWNPMEMLGTGDDSE